MNTFTNTQTMVMESCCDCGIDFAITKEFYQTKLKDGTTFSCPNGHKQHYSEPHDKEQEIAELKDQINRERIRNSHLRETRDHYQNRMNGYKGHATRIKNAIAKGKCPCCNEHFEDLHDHMKTKHPTFQKEEA